MKKRNIGLKDVFSKFTEELQDRVKDRAILAVQEVVDGYFAGVTSIADKKSPGGPEPRRVKRRRRRRKASSTVRGGK